MEQITLNAITRDLLGKKVKILRQKEQIPAICYGRNFKSIPLILPAQEFKAVSKEAGEATIINLAISDKEPLKALIRNIQKDPVSDDILHVDLYKVDMKQEIQTEIPLVFEGTSPAVEEQEGNLITNKDSVKVECLPDKLVSEIKVDTTVLKSFDDLIKIKDLNIPSDIRVLDEPEDVVAQVTPPRSEEELEAIKTEGAAETEKAQIEGIEAEAEKEKLGKEAEKGEARGEGTPPQENRSQKTPKNEQKK